MLAKILKHLVPNADFSYIGEPTNNDEYNKNVTWHDDRPQPSWDEIKAAKPVVETAEATEAITLERRAAYVNEADPLFFGWQRGENTEQEWLDKVAEIRDRHPYPS